MSKSHRCIFCLKENEQFSTVEHIVPQSLGNTDDILLDAVCDKCQNYFGKEIERYTLSQTPFGFWRTMSDTKTKKGEKPFFNFSQVKDKCGRLDDFHQLTDNSVVIHPADGESIIECAIFDKDIRCKILSGEKTHFDLVITPKMLVYIGRFLGKIALEYLCKELGNRVFDCQFNELRNYVRHGTTNSIWPVILGVLDENLLTYKKINEIEETHTLYAYSLYEDVCGGFYLFNFDIGTERYSLVLNCKFPAGIAFSKQLLAVLCKGTKELPKILFYNIQDDSKGQQGGFS